LVLFPVLLLAWLRWISEGFCSDVFGSEDLGSVAFASGFLSPSFASPGFAPAFFFSSALAFSSPFAVRLPARPAGPVSIDLR
jgi:hypothetical protein